MNMTSVLFDKAGRLREQVGELKAENARLRHGIGNIVRSIERARADSDERTVIDAAVIERHLRALL